MPKNLDPNDLAYMECKNGELVPAWNNSKEAKGWQAEATRCGWKHCIELEEKHHICQAKLRCPNVCKPNCAQPNTDGKALFFNTACTRFVECYASASFVNCVLPIVCKLAKKRKQNKRCVAKLLLMLQYTLGESPTACSKADRIKLMPNWKDVDRLAAGKQCKNK